MQEVIQQENCHACGGPDIPASGAYPAQSVAVMSYQELLKTCVMVARLAAETARFFRDIAVANDRPVDAAVTSTPIFLAGWDEASAVLEAADAALETVYESPAATDPAQSSFVVDPVANFDNRWYAITVGRIPGVYRGAHHLSGNSTGTPGGTVQRFTNKDHALAAYHAAVIAGNALEVTVTTTRRVIVPSDPVTIID